MLNSIPAVIAFAEERRLSTLSVRSRKSSIASHILEAAANPMEILTAKSLPFLTEEAHGESEWTPEPVEKDASIGALFR